jgi:hypothetical protein
MELEELKAAWADLDRRLEASLRLNRKLLTATSLGRVRSALERLSIALGVEAAVWLILILLTGRFIANHLHPGRFALAAGLLDAYLIANFIAVIRQIVATNRIDHAQPIASIQKQFEALRVERVRAIRWSLLAGMLAWTPFLVVILKACLDLDAFEILGGLWLLCNLVFSVLCVGVAIWLSRRQARSPSGPVATRPLMDHLVGANMRSAARHLAEVAAFEEEAAGIPQA